MLEDEFFLAEQTRRQFELEPDGLRLEPIFRGGSDRAFYRVYLPDATSCILMHYGDEKQENFYYVAIARFLESLDIPVPRILHDDAAQRLVWIEDLGKVDLYTWRTRSWLARKLCYERVLAHLRVLHRDGLARLEENPMPLMEGFGERLYGWEQNYFWEQCVEGIFCLNPQKRAEIAAELKQLVQRLCELPKCLIHRDLQSQNIMLFKEKTVLIDFQGMRNGTYFYDLGSLLFDPYVEFKPEHRIELLKHYYELESADFSWKVFQQAFYDASAQRLMQALGAYGFLGIKKQKKQFLKYVPAALNHLAFAANASGNLPQLATLVQRLLAETENNFERNISRVV